MTGRSRTTAIVVATALLITGAAFAQGMGGTGRGSGGRPGGMMPGGGGMNESFGPGNINAFRMLAGRLDLTDFQKEELETILTDAREDMEELREAAAPSEERVYFMDLFTSPMLTVSDLEENLGGDEELREAGREIIFQAIVDIHDVLTDEQLAELADMVEEHAGSGPDGMRSGMMGGRGMGGAPQRGAGSMSGR